MLICFDIGNVLLEVNLDKFTEELKKFIKPEHDPMFFLETIQAMHDTGNITMNQALWSHHDIKEQDRKYLLDCWNQCLTRNEKMMKFLIELLDNKDYKKYQIALLSNIGYEHAKYLEKLCPEMFQSGIIRHFSYQVGVRKPSKLFFQSFKMEYKKLLKEKYCVYFDDRPENIETGKNYLTDRSIEFNLCTIKNLDKTLKSIKYMLDSYYYGDTWYHCPLTTDDVVKLYGTYLV